MGIEPTYAAWEAAVLPLNYTRIEVLITLAGTRRQGLEIPWLFPFCPGAAAVPGATRACQKRFRLMALQVALTRERLLWQARRLEQQASLAETEEEQDRLLNQTVALRLLANLPRYNPDLH